MKDTKRGCFTLHAFTVMGASVFIASFQGWLAFFKIRVFNPMRSDVFFYR